jgi:hypothetical protein
MPYSSTFVQREQSSASPRRRQNDAQATGDLGYAAALECIESEDVVLCDSNIFTGRHVKLLAALLSLPNEILITDDVENELKSYVGTRHERSMTAP